MKNLSLKLLVILPVFLFANIANSQYCKLKVDIEKGTVDGIKPSAEWVDCKTTLGCFDEWQVVMPPEYIDYQIKMYIGVEWNLTKNYFLIQEDNFIIEALPYFGKSKKEITGLFGKPVETRKQKDEDREMLFYEKPYGTFVVVFEESVSRRFMISELNALYSYTELTIIL